MPTLPEPADRALMPDLLRAFALFGIAVVNVIGFAQPFTSGFYNGGLNTGLDQAAYAGVTGLFLMKSYPLFSMMFGAGLSYQLAAAARAGKDFGPRYFRRMAALIVLGALHFVFFWIGDILLTYGLLGCLLFVLRDASVRVLVRTGIILIALNILILLSFGALIWAGETYAPEAMAEAGYDQMEAEALTAFGDGTFLQAAAYRLNLLPFVLPSVIIQQGVAVFGFFCFGLAAVKSGVLDQPLAPIWKLSRRIFLPVGLVGSAAGAWILLQASSSVDSTFLLGSGVIMAFSAFAALGYCGLIAAVSGGVAGPFRRFLARAGSASLDGLSSAVAALFADLFRVWPRYVRSNGGRRGDPRGGGCGGRISCVHGRLAQLRAARANGGAAAPDYLLGPGLALSFAAQRVKRRTPLIRKAHLPP